MATAFVGWTTVAGLVTYSYAGAAPTAPVAATTPVATAAVNQATQLSDAFASVAEHVAPSVVTIKVEAKQAMPQIFRNPFFRGEERGSEGVVQGSGSGIVFRGDGAILTNNHVVEHATRIEVVLKDGRRFKAKVAGRDPAVDLAVLKIDATNLPAVTFADSGKARQGDWVLAIGSPFGLDYTLTAGVLSGKGRRNGTNQIEDYLQTDASINPGNSGGPLVDLNGQVLGINTMIIGGSGIGFAIPANLARSVGEQLLANGKVKRAWLGVSFQELTPELAKSLGKSDTHGALIAGVDPAGPASKAGVRAGDIIERLDQESISEGRDLLNAVLQRPVGTNVTLAIRRDGKAQSIQLKTAERPMDLRAGRGDEGDDEGAEATESAPKELGMALQSLSPSIANQLGYKGTGKVLITNVRPGSPAQKADLEPGDVIVEADRQAVSSPTEVANAARDGNVLLRVERGQRSFYAVLSKDHE
ncbi:MAG: Do family serine endopeptidase [Polyangiales bacterium]